MPMIRHMHINHPILNDRLSKNAHSDFICHGPKQILTATTVFKPNDLMLLTVLWFNITASVHFPLRKMQ